MDLLEVFGVKESYKLPDAIMDRLFSDRCVETLAEIRKSGITNIRDYYQEEQGDRKKLKQDFTPDGICRIVSGLMLDGDFLDICAGTGALTKEAVEAGHRVIHEQEYSERTIAFSLLEACLNGMTGVIERADCLRGTVQNRYELHRSGAISIPKEVPVRAEKKKYRNVIMNPPYSMKFPDAGEYEFFGMKVPKSKADYGFVLKGLRHLEDDGRLIAILPHGVLFRGKKEEAIRKWLVQNRLVNAVIGLPDNMFLNTGIPVFILVLQRGSEGTLFIDASKEFQKDGKVNIMTPDQIRKVMDIFRMRIEVERYSNIASQEEMQENGYNLNIPRYVDTYIPEPLPDLKTLLNDLEQLQAEEDETCRELIGMLQNLKADSEEGNRAIGKHIEVLQKSIRKKPEIKGQMEMNL